MQEAVSTRTPVHLWIVGILSLLWSCFGAYDYVMSHMRDTHYIASAMPGVDPTAALAWMDAFPIYAKVGWALGVWGGLLGAILLLIRSRYALWAFALSMIGIVLSIGYQLVAGPKLPGAPQGAFADDQVEHGVAQKLHALVAAEAVGRNGGVGQRFLEQVGVLERVAEDGLGTLAGFGIHDDMRSNTRGKRGSN